MVDPVLKARDLIAVVSFLSALFGARATADPLLIIANPSVVIAERLMLDDIRSIYLLRMTRWPDGSPIVPINREARSEAREHFRQAVLRQDEESLVAYWNEMHYGGKSPPLVQQSDAAMIAFVRRIPGAIGYIRDIGAPEGVTILARIP